MIIDIARFQRKERPYWDELEQELDLFDRDHARSFDVDRAQRFYYLYRRAASDLIALNQFPSEVELHAYVENIVARAYAEIHETRKRSRVRSLGFWLRRTLPQTFRRQAAAFFWSCGLTLIGAVLGAAIILYDYDSKMLVLPFPHLEGNPSDRVAFEEAAETDRMEGGKSSFSAMLMVNNIRVSILALAFGITFGVGTGILLFYNGVILGAVACDYLMAGEGVFLLGWLLPHGSVEIPAILLGGQAGFALGFALVGWGNSVGLRRRLEAIRGDLVTLISGAALLLVWAGIIESFFSQYHEPYLPYWVKIAFGTIQLVLLFAYLFFVGRETKTPEHAS